MKNIKISKSNTGTKYESEPTRPIIQVPGMNVRGPSIEIFNNQMSPGKMMDFIDSKMNSLNLLDQKK